MNLSDLQPGDRVYRWVFTGMDSGSMLRAETSDMQELTVVRVNRVTVTVDNDYGARFRVPHGDIAGRADW